MGVTAGSDGRRHRAARPCSACRRRRCSPHWSSASCWPCCRWLPAGYPARRASPRRACSASTSARWSTRTRSTRWAPTGRSWSAVAVATLLLSIVAGALLGLHRDVTPLTGSLALVAGGASGLVAIARELGGDDRVVSVVQYLRVGTGHRVDARGRDAGLPRRQVARRRDRRPKPIRPLGISASPCSSRWCLSGRRSASWSGCPARGCSDRWR